MKDGGGYERDLDGELDIKIRDEREKNKSGTQISCSRKKKMGTIEADKNK